MESKEAHMEHLRNYALNKAVLQRNIDRIIDMVQLGADVQFTDDSGQSLLHISDSVLTIRTLINLGANINAKNYEGRTPLGHVIKNHNFLSTSPCLYFSLIKEFLKYNPNVIDTDFDGNTPLHLYVYAFEYDSRAIDFEIMEKLLHLGINVNKRNNKRDTALNIAVIINRYDAVKFLLQHGADPNVKDRTEDSAFLRTVCTNRFFKSDILEEFLSFGADMHSRDRFGNTPLHLAAYNTFLTLSILRVLLTKSTTELLHLKNLQGQTPLHILLSRVGFVVDSDIIKEFLIHGANINEKDDTGDTCLHAAASNSTNTPNIYSILLKAGADVNAKNNLNSTPLHVIFKVRSEHLFEAAKIFLQYGADPNLVDAWGNSILLCALKNCDFTLSFLKLMLEGGVRIDDFFKNDRNIQSVLDLCIRENKEEHTAILLKYVSLINSVETCELRTKLKFTTVQKAFNERMLKFILLCEAEICHMKIDKICGKFILHDLMTQTIDPFSVLENEEDILDLSLRIIDRLDSGPYPIYRDVLQCIRKSHLVKNLEKIQVCIKKTEKKNVVLDIFSIEYLTKFLGKRDIANIITAFRKKEIDKE